MQSFNLTHGSGAAQATGVASEGSLPFHAGRLFILGWLLA